MLIIHGKSDSKTKAIVEMFERGDGVIRDLSIEKSKYERMIAREPRAARDYTSGKFNVQGDSDA